MKRLMLLGLFLCLSFAASAQQPDTVKKEKKGYLFTDLKSHPTTPVRDQNRSGTCWSYSALSFLESEILRAGGGETDLSSMWIVRNSFFDKAVKYVRMHGNLTFAEGGQAHDVTNTIRRYGIVPTSVYPGLNYGTTKPDFVELTSVLTAYVKSISNQSTLSTAWQRGLNGILDAYFGVMPERFTYQGKEYTPASYAASLPIKMDDYVDLTSFTHHPFYHPFALEIPDNWSWDLSYNLPLTEMMAVIDSALESGYTIEWATDVSERGFNRTKAIGIVPDTEIESLEGTEAAKWGKMTPAEREATLCRFDKPVPEKSITQELRQTAFDNFKTQDDHGMQIMGTAVDQVGNEYYKVKNSWGERSGINGYYYFSKPFVAYKTTGIMINKNAIPKELRKKLGL